jgi:hypothetical protein
VSGTLDWGVLDEKMTPQNTKLERRKWDFGPTSVILCHNSVGAVDYVETKCVLKVKLLSVPKKDRCKILEISAKFLSSRLIYSRVLRNRNTHQCPYCGIFAEQIN